MTGPRGHQSLLLPIVATAVVAIAFQPVRERVQRLANRLVYGKRATPYEVLAQFADRMAGTYATEELLPRMAQLLAEGTAAARADVWLADDGQFRNDASWPPGAPPLPPISADAPDGAAQLPWRRPHRAGAATGASVLGALVADQAARRVADADGRQATA